MEPRGNLGIRAFGSPAQDGGDGRRREWKPVIVVVGLVGPPRSGECKLPAGIHLLHLAPETRRGDAAARTHGPLPIDVKHAGPWACRAEPQHAPPPAILWSRDVQVVGNNVENNA